MPINLRRVGEVADGSVTEAKLATGAVTVTKIGAGAITNPKLGTSAVTESKIGASAVTVNKIGDGAVTGVKAAENLKTSFLTADDTSVNYTGTAYSNEKEMRFVVKEADIPSGEIVAKAEAMSSLGTTNVGIYFDAETSPRIELATVGTGFELLEGTAYVGDLVDGVHSVSMRLKNVDGGIAYNKLIELHGRV